MAKKRLLLGERELEVMKALWKVGRGSVYDVQKTIKGRRAYTTVQTMLNYLERKGVVGHEVEGRTFVYYARASRDKTLNDHLADLVERVFDGSVQSVLTGLGEAEGLSDDELSELKRLMSKEDR